MRKRIFWISVGVAAGIVIAAKSSAYVRAHTPGPADTFFASAQSNPAARTAATILNEFNAYRREREEELTNLYARKYGATD